MDQRIFKFIDSRRNNRYEIRAEVLSVHPFMGFSIKLPDVSLLNLTEVDICGVRSVPIVIVTAILFRQFSLSSSADYGEAQTDMPIACVRQRPPFLAKHKEPDVGQDDACSGAIPAANHAKVESFASRSIATIDRTESGAKPG